MPALTKAAADAELVDRAGAYLALARWSTATDGTNPATVGPLRFGLAVMGRAPTAAGAIVDADLSGVASSDFDRVYDLAELRLKRNLLSKLNTMLRNETIGDKSQELGGTIDQLQREVTDLEARVKMLYGHGLGKISAGNIDLGFATTDPNQTTPIWPY
jgi:hypothetical protein